MWWNGTNRASEVLYSMWLEIEMQIVYSDNQQIPSLQATNNVFKPAS